MESDTPIPKAPPPDTLGRFREIVADPVNLLIERDPWAGFLRNGRLVLHNGNRVPIEGPGSYYGTFGHILIINRGVHEPLEEFCFQEMLRVMPEAPVMIELGAYWAHYSMWMMKARPRATTIMVEPEKENLEGGRANFAHNGYTGEFIEGFVGKDQWLPGPFMANRGLAHLDVLHVDIQGYEVELLEGSADLLARRAIDYLFVSTHSQGIHRHVAELLSAHGYRIEASSDFVETTSFDGLIFASSPDAKPIFRDLRPFSRPDIARRSGDDILRELGAVRAAIVGR